ncbi:MAG TPA: type VI secretion system accessory protein TagJ [Fimbriiglobus sp.]|jgi:type VI secretion system protein ImpE
MSPRDAFEAGELEEALRLQTEAVDDRPDDPAARLFLFELLALSGRFIDARDQLLAVETDDPAWPRVRRGFRRLLRAAYRRQRGRRPELFAGIPRHAARRWAAIRAIGRNDPGRAVRRIDKANAVSPIISGHLDGREFLGLRDADDRFASVLEVLFNGRYTWVPFEHLRRATLRPALGPLDAAFRPARIKLATGDEFDGHLPLVYPESEIHGGVFACGQEIDYLESDDGPALCIGARVLMTGDEELLLADAKQLDVRAGSVG